MTATLHQASATVDRSAASIEGAFLRAGESLSRGLDMFERLGTRLTSIMEELNSGAVTGVSATLDGLSRKLVVISDALPRDALTLGDLVAANEAIAKRLESLLESMRMMTIIARSARIEAVTFDEASDLETFTQEISDLTRAVRVKVDGCAGDHAKLTDRLRDVARAQTVLDRDFRDRLLVLAQDLSKTFALIDERQRAGVDLVREVAANSSRISQAAGSAMVSLQSGDSTRQRLEHVASAVRWADALQGGGEVGGAGPDPGVPENARPSAVAASCRLQEAQLHDTVSCFSADVSRIDEALARLLRDTLDLADKGRTTYGSAGNGAETFLSVFKARLSTATDLLRICEASRHHVERAIADLRAMLDALDKTIATLSTIGLELVMAGLNAGLKAARLGSKGRSFVVIADELNRLAKAISTEARELIRVFADVRQVSDRLDRTEAASTATDTDRDIVAIVGALDEGDRKLAAFLQSMGETIGPFDADLTRVREDFRTAVAMNADLLATAADLGAFADGLPEGDDGDGFPFVASVMEPRYTMAREREIHSQVAGQRLAA